MKKMKRFIKLTLFILAVLVVLSFLSYTFSDFFGDWMRKAGMSEEQIDKVDQFYDNAMDKVQQGVGYVGKELTVMKDRLADLVAGSDEAYKVVAKLYTETRMKEHYTILDGKHAGGKSLCSINNLVGGRNQDYQAGINPFEDGSPAWYAFGRFREDNNMTLGGMTAEDPLQSVEDWTRQVYIQNNPDADLSRYVPTSGYLAANVFVVRDSAKVYPHSIAVCDSTMFYVEDVYYENGVPTQIYYSLAEDSGVLRVMSYGEFMEHFTIRGYIVPLNIFI